MRKTDITKNAIINSTIKLMRADGCATIKDICADAKTNIASVNYHFSDKETLYGVVIRRLINDLKTKIDEIILNGQQNQLPKRDLLTLIIKAFSDFSIENKKVITFITSDNKDYFDTATKYFYHVFSPTSDIAHKIVLAFKSELSAPEQESRYLLFLSAVLFTILPEYIKLNNSDDKSTLSLSNHEMQNAYINNMLDILTK